MARHDHKLLPTIDLDLPPTPPKDNAGTSKNPVPLHKKVVITTWLKRNVNILGYWQLAVLLCGNIALILAVAFLWYIWKPGAGAGARAGFSEDDPWILFVFSNWTLRAITLTSIVIRTSMTMQAAIFCMFVASIALQRGDVLLQDAAAVSIYRFTNSGPQNMILPLFFARKGWKSDIAIIMTALLSLTTICSQFTSTILLMDIGKELLVAPSKWSNVSYSGDATRRWAGYISSYGNSWTERPSNFPIFAELPSIGDIFLHNQENEGALFATGTIVRALLPLDKPTRETLAAYKGPATIIDARVVCIPPYIHKLTERGDYINATIGIDTFLEHSDELIDAGYMGRHRLASPYLEFSCVVPLTLPSPSKIYEWQTSLCTQENGLESDDRTEDTGFGRSWLVMNITRLTTQELWDNITVTTDQPGYGDSVDGEWTKFSSPMPEGHPLELDSFDISLSLCFSSSNSRVIQIEAAAGVDRNRIEPSLVLGADKLTYNSTAIRKFIGAENGSKEDLSPEKRGILEINNYTMDTVVQLNQGDNWIPSSLIDEALNSSASFAPTAAMCIWCYVYVKVHEGYISIFENTLRMTTHPALAIQALLTTRALQIYESRRTDLTNIEPAQLSCIVEYQVPIRTDGFSAILALIGFHMFLMIYVVVLFFQMRGHTSLGQSWQAVSQLEGEETMEMMAYAKRATDVEVEEWLTERGMKKERIGIKEGRVTRRRGGGGGYKYMHALDSEDTA